MASGSGGVAGVEMQKKRTAILISGRGSNMSALLSAAEAPDFPAEISLVISNRPDAAGLQVAEAAGIRTLVLNHRDFADRIAFDASLDAHLRIESIDIVCLAGFMRLLTPWLVERWRNRMINVHPSLLPAFPGLDTHGRALEAGVRFHGCTVHFVRPVMDSGPIILQAAVPVLPQDDADGLAARVLRQEHAIYPAALRLLAGGQLSVENERVEITGARFPTEVMISPEA
ncbi:phosphoribosylglycinamide formyltransferase [Aquabacter cavernae]|uniref:phosphoribosylglycinamide formyltransferase n=1 Tax=Aquabacter cavernae TaxID=2496029 RepID=UPI001FE152C6|nr:phosphoribosylglycinamide formyltransferase [Aquabacter cavernae]